MIRKHWLWVLLFTFSLQGCATMKLQDKYSEELPVLTIEQYFQGVTYAKGEFVDLFGKVRNRFEVIMRGRVEGNVLILDEDFIYEDGSTSNRLWKIKILADGHYEGEAGDVIGIATGRSKGNTFNWTYEMDLPIKGRSWRVKFDDWLFLQKNGQILNIADVSKWGFTLGTLTFYFSKDRSLISDESLKKFRLDDPIASGNTGNEHHEKH
ncbi:DUF3833 domain-containing protein [Endozoicomonas arenosclerae]|uniref:DUF3833 domain-containing protein n=1 Tax=Endozoicomonas arenosclerae TaxID=1633495 RepID=UPI0009A19DDF|nr:DUF3833 domain-containing protein [Endozoicomonas arenosclerae]